MGIYTDNINSFLLVVGSALLQYTCFIDSYIIISCNNSSMFFSSSRLICLLLGCSLDARQIISWMRQFYFLTFLSVWYCCYAVDYVILQEWYDIVLGEVTGAVCNGYIWKMIAVIWYIVGVGERGRFGIMKL